ncbi:MAG: DMT family transporter [Thermoplasmatota archaeon]
MGEKSPRDTRLAAGLAFVLVSFALNSAMTRFVVSRHLLDPGLLTFVRFIAGALTLVALTIGTRRGAGAFVPGRDSVLPAIWLGSYALLISYGYEFISAAAGTFVFYGCVLATILGADIVLRKSRISGRAMAGGACALLGLGVLALGSVAGTTPLGVLLLAGTGISWGAYSHLGRSSQDALSFTSRNFTAVAVVFALALFGEGALASVGGPALATTSEGLLVGIFMGACTTALSYVVWYWALPQIGAAQAGTYQLVIPVITTLIGIVALGEPWSARLALAAGLVLLGMALATPPEAWRRPRTGLAARDADA